MVVHLDARARTVVGAVEHVALRRGVEGAFAVTADHPARVQAVAQAEVERGSVLRFVLDGAFGLGDATEALIVAPAYVELYGAGRRGVRPGRSGGVEAVFLA